MGKTRILVVDDSTTNVVLLEAILSEQGYEIYSAMSALEAFQILKKNKVDLILLDLLMPKVSGFDFLKEVKRNNHLKEIPVIVVSALNDMANVKKTLAMGAIDFVQKPIDIQQFVEKVDAILNKKSIIE
ncbi:MAG: response regulator [Bacteroidota bacterium]|nr:response regulator [Bacteroidota bacterium]MDP4225202.1 response regulator [Bacteroidota bacterium]MDP4272851.1 response regulator [Bacteroidota bacterium]